MGSLGVFGWSYGSRLGFEVNSQSIREAVFASDHGDVPSEEVQGLKVEGRLPVSDFPKDHCSHQETVGKLGTKAQDLIVALGLGGHAPVRALHVLEPKMDN